jgi:hypothetical protein
MKAITIYAFNATRTTHLIEDCDALILSLTVQIQVKTKIKVPGRHVWRHVRFVVHHGLLFGINLWKHKRLQGGTTLEG